MYIKPLLLLELFSFDACESSIFHQNSKNQMHRLVCSNKDLSGYDVVLLKIVNSLPFCTSFRSCVDKICTFRLIIIDTHTQFH